MAHRRSAQPTECLAFLTATALAAWWVLTLAPDAEAYIDPSAGGMLVQLLLAGTAGVAVIGKLFWQRIRRVFGATDTTPTGASEGTTDSSHDRV
jgi:hypothetical protein